MAARRDDPLQLKNVPISDVKQLADFAVERKISLTVVGPEAHLAAGAVDEFRARGLRIFGPTKAAAQLESSKAFAKAFMKRHGIPTAAYETFTDTAAAHAYTWTRKAPIVIKADGLAAGKGVVVAMTPPEAHEAIDWILADNKLGVVHNEGGARVVIEEFLQGEEASFIVLCDGKNVVPLATSQDHKRLLDGDQGPNTGGMGAYSPAPVVTPNVHAGHARDHPADHRRHGGKDGIPFTGFLYAGLMIDEHGQPRTVEFNTRMGDPETQPIMMRLKSDLLDVLMHATDGTLDQVELQWDRRAAPRRRDGRPRLPAHRARATSSPACLPMGRTAWSSTPARCWRTRLRPAAAACSAPRRWASRSSRRRSALRDAAPDPIRRPPAHRHRPPRHQALNALRRSPTLPPCERPFGTRAGSLAWILASSAGALCSTACRLSRA